MNSTLVTSFLRQRLTSPIRVGLLLIAIVFPLGFCILSKQLDPLKGIAGPIALVFAAGAIGQDVSSGTLQLLLVRPVSRPSYLVSRWLASVIGAMAITVPVMALGALGLAIRGVHLAPLELVAMLLESATSAAAQAAVMVMLSTLVNGLGDVGILFAGVIVLQMLGAVAVFAHWSWLARASEELQGVLSPKLSWEWLAHLSVPILDRGGERIHTGPSWYAMASWASTLTLALAAGIARLNRRELSYGAG